MEIKMKVAVSSTGKDLESQLDPRFGRCGYFIIVETEDMSFEAFENENVGMSGGAGIQSASFVSSKGAKAVLTGNCGPKAIHALTAGGLEVFTGLTGTIKDVVEKYKKGEQRPVTEANVPEKFGGRGMGDGRRGMGDGRRGMGDGRRGMGGGGRGMGGGGRGMGGGGKGIGGGGKGMGGGGKGMDGGGKGMAK